MGFLPNKKEFIEKYYKFDELGPTPPKKGRPRLKQKNSSQHKPKNLWSEFDYYKEKVKILTEQNKNQIAGINKRGFNKYHIDHKISIHYGFNNGILPEHIAHFSNCHMLWCTDNIRKNKDIIVDEENLWILNED